ncbi:hypothetical protein NKH77_34050 [Streptomyces sp. M19]
MDRLTITDPDTPRLTALVDRLAAHWPGHVRAAERPPLAHSDIAVNATRSACAPTTHCPSRRTRCRRAPSSPTSS